MQPGEAEEGGRGTSWTLALVFQPQEPLRAICMSGGGCSKAPLLDAQSGPQISTLRASFTTASPPEPPPCSTCNTY